MKLAALGAFVALAGAGTAAMVSKPAGILVFALGWITGAGASQLWKALR